jgi:hypothetical protein
MDNMIRSYQVLYSVQEDYKSILKNYKTQIESYEAQKKILLESIQTCLDRINEHGIDSKLSNNDFKHVINLSSFLQENFQALEIFHKNNTKKYNNNIEDYKNFKHSRQVNLAQKIFEYTKSIVTNYVTDLVIDIDLIINTPDTDFVYFISSAGTHIALANNDNYYHLIEMYEKQKEYDMIMRYDATTQILYQVTQDDIKDTIRIVNLVD